MKRTFIAVCALVLMGLAAPGHRSPATAAAPGGEAGRRAAGLGPADLRTVAFYSPALGATTHAAVLLPDGYAPAGRRYPVLYLLAGHTGTYRQWPTHSDVAALARGLPLIVVMPDGLRGWYANPVGGAGQRWDDYLVDDLIPYVDRHYRTVAARAGRAVAGLSMGGLGAMDYAARHPDTFVAAASFSGFLDLALLEAPAWRAAYPSLSSVFGDPRADAWYWDGNNPVALAPNLRGVRLYLASGNGQPGPLDRPHSPADPEEADAHAALADMAAALARAGIPATIDDYGPGIHGWAYYARDLRHALPLIMDAFAHPPASATTTATAPPVPWSYRTVERRFAVWGYRVERTGGGPGWVVLDAVSPSALTAMGDGRLAITTAPLYRPGAAYTITVDGARQGDRADASGRLHLSLALSGSAAPRRLAIAPAPGGRAI